ncbi:MAG: phosphate butyryltransferase, partial [Clostridiales Family XIII bacterium]|nr:phosphate butyryltransferase [Clostridiales Family XIII bacterium]
NEKVDEKMPATVDAANLAAIWAKGEIPGCIIEGPITMDVALSKDAAVHKGIDSKIAGETDLFIVPDIEAGNMVGKTLIYCAGAKMAGVILGADYPIVMASRAENAEGKLNSIALAATIAR